MMPESDIVLPGQPGPWKRPLAFVDNETTGLRAESCDIIETAIIRDAIPWASKIRITQWDEQRADNLTRPNDKKTWRDLTGYSRDEWRSAPTAAELAPQVASQLHGCVIVAHNAPFDVEFMASYLERNGIAWRRVWCGSMIDTYPLAKSVLGPLGLKKFSLHACCEFLGLEPEGIHRALGGALRVRALYGQLCKWIWDGRGGRVAAHSQ